MIIEMYIAKKLTVWPQGTYGGDQYTTSMHTLRYAHQKIQYGIIKAGETTMSIEAGSLNKSLHIQL